MKIPSGSNPPQARPKMIYLKKGLLSGREFAVGSSALACVRYQPVDRLADSFRKYGITEIYVDVLCRAILNNPKIVKAFLERQAQGATLEDNLATVFEGQLCLAFLHEGTRLSITANEEVLSLALEISPQGESLKDQFIAVIEADRNRTSSPPTSTHPRIDRNGDPLNEYVQSLGMNVITAERKL